jgi:antibiotic biosynthesis monooxygenase (ABM) superfamily enzyme
MASAPDKVLELVVFKLKPGATREDLLATNDALSSWARQQPGFISREQAYDAEGDRWIDLLWWETIEDARAASEAAMTSESCAPMFALIDEEATLMIHADAVIAPVHADATSAGA